MAAAAIQASHRKVSARGDGARTAWLKEGFTGCHQKTLTPDNRVQEITISVSKVAAICIRVKLKGFSGNVTKQMEILEEPTRPPRSTSPGLGLEDWTGQNGKLLQEAKELEKQMATLSLKGISPNRPQFG